MPRYTMRQLEYLVAAAEHKSVAKAAAALHVSQPSVSTAIAKLEDQLGVQLLVRHHALGISLTRAGERLVSEGRNLLRHAGELERQARRAGGEISGTLNLASFVTLAPAFLPGLIAGFKEQYPQVNIGITEATQNDLFNGLRQARFELALLYDVSLPADIHAVPLATQAPHVLLPRGHNLAKQKTISLKSLAAFDMILLDVPPSREYFLGLFRAYGLEPNVALSSSSLELVRGLVGRGLGFSLLITRPYGDKTYDGEGLVVRPISEGVEPGRIVLARSVNLRPTRLMATFEEFCTSFFDGEGS
ncbi:MAG: LysR family transcriptional regulator [Hyphomicrobiales bacterium]